MCGGYVVGKPKCARERKRERRVEKHRRREGDAASRIYGTGETIGITFTPCRPRSQSLCFVPSHSSLREDRKHETIEVAAMRSTVARENEIRELFGQDREREREK